jgi:ABC-type lipoprotein export system ATPase subunit
MSVSISDLRERVATQFSDVEQVDKSIIRGTRKMGDVPFAVCYFDVAQELPETPETLTKYQDRVIGSHYFDGGKSLQWNNYLYFITDRKHLENRQALKAKELIESDRNYARKLVIAEEDLDSVLSPAVIAPTGAFPRTNILSVWVEHLVEAGLDKAILSSDDLPKRLDLIESPPPQHSTRPKVPMQRAQVTAAPFIRSLELKMFRPFPIQRSFEFGTVNLIFGANGSGKTSLLEALELFYCGKTKRNPSSPGRYELVARLGDGKSEKASSNRGLQLFRDRNLNWYGQSEVKSTNLYQSFAQFNFLDTDAAVHLADSSSSEMEEDLSKLLVGPDASKTWRDIERVSSALDMKLKDLRPLQAQTKEDLAVLEKQVKETSSIKRESDSIRVRLEEMVKRLGWDSGQGDKVVIANRLVESLAELVPLARQAAELDWTETPVSIEGLTKYCRESKVTSEKAEATITRLETLQKNQKRHSDTIVRCKEALELVKQARRLIDAGVPTRAVERGKQESIVATHSGWLAGLDAEALGALPDADLQMTVEAWQRAAVAKRSAAQRLLTAAKNEHSNFTKLRDQSFNLLQELRQVAGKILKSSTKSDECPLCHTQFGPGELAKHMVMGIDEHVESLGQELLGRVSAHDVAVREASVVASAADWLSKFCEHSGTSAGIAVRLALTKVEEARRALAAASSQIEKLDKEEAALEAQGLSASRLEEIGDRLHGLDYPLSELSPVEADRLVLKIGEDSATSSRTLERERAEAATFENELTEVLGSAESSLRSFRAALARQKERLVTTERIRAKLSDFSSSFVWPAKKALAELVVEAESVRKVAVELQDALGREKLAQASYVELTNRIEKLRGYLKQLGPQIKRLADAKSVLDSLQREFSLEKAMNSALQQNRTAIEAIFSAIHMPREFRGLGSTWTTIVRKADGTEAKLSEISTGQRAAFALSIFLAQNAQLTVAPPVVLIDDPIAHVDDLNSLSFLDYLRELALTGRRQIFFATANDKLASLFERKFDFLGKDGFRRFDLRREIN